MWKAVSVNKDIIDTHQSMDTLMALRRCKNGLKERGGILKLDVTKRVLLSVRHFKTRYEKYRKTSKQILRKAGKRKRQEDIDVFC